MDVWSADLSPRFPQAQACTPAISTAKSEEPVSTPDTKPMLLTLQADYWTAFKFVMTSMPVWCQNAPLTPTPTLSVVGQFVQFV